jgi:hypothetical protein
MSNARDKANIPALNFSSTGIDDNATSTAITIDSSEKVGINSTAPSSDAWTGARTLVIKETDITKDNGITIISSSATNNGNIAFADTSGGGFSDIGGLITYLHNGDSFRFMTANTERMRLNSTGLGIGTSSPGAKLEIQTGSDWGNIINSTYAGTQYFQQFEYNGTSIGKIRGDNSSIAIESGSNLILQTANTERMRIANNGDISFLDSTGATTRFFWDTSLRSIGINTTAPETALHVALSGTNYGGVNAGTEPGHVLTISSAGNGGAGRGTSMVFQSPGSGSSVTTAKIDALQNSQSSIASNANLVFNVANTSGNLTRRLLIGNGGNISFYEDTGTTPLFVWNASTERLGIGTGNPQNKIDISATTWNDGLTIKNTGNFNVGIIGDANRTSAGGGLLNLASKWNGKEVAGILFQAGSDTTNKDDGEIVFRTSSANNISERMRIGSDGRVLVNTTSNGTESSLNVQGQFGMSTARGFIFETQEGRNGSGFTSITLQFTTGANGRTCFIESMVGSSAFYLHHIAHKYSGNTTNVLTNDNNGPTVSWSVSNSGSNTGSVYTYVVNFPYGTSHPYAKFKVSLGGYITTPITSPSITFTQ